jgi:hypothetical protein
MICMKCKKLSSFKSLNSIYPTDIKEFVKNESTFYRTRKTPMKSFLYLDIISWLKQNRKQKN